ncbi:MAG TPA: ZIP family metal transporter [Cryomorphaceae bacterium]|nr:ZIP family metal transporter [Cryomorphaceae bacterium]|tara:strand:+ start:1903 stop:2595 length:693 start_codon:yes stop_codon:yes gene_type:complete
MIPLVLFLAVLLGGSASYIINTKSALFKLTLAFSGAFLFGTLMTHMLPEVFQNSSGGLWVLLGFGIQLLLDFISKGLEHGHLHTHENRIPVLPLVGLFIHAFIEGMPLGLDIIMHDHRDELSTNGLLWSVALHKIPIALLVATALRSAGLTTWKVLLGILLFALSSPLGNAVSVGLELDPASFLPVLGVATGLLLHVSTTILFESAANHQFNAMKMFVVVVGIALSLLLL